MRYLLYAVGLLVAVLFVVSQIGLVFMWWVCWRITKALAQTAEKTPKTSSDDMADITVALVPRYLEGQTIDGQWTGIYVGRAGKYKYHRFTRTLEVALPF